MIRRTDPMIPYGLTYDEVLIIDPTPPFTQEEYEQEDMYEC